MSDITYLDYLEDDFAFLYHWTYWHEVTPWPWHYSNKTEDDEDLSTPQHNFTWNDYRRQLLVEPVKMYSVRSRHYLKLMDRDYSVEDVLELAPKKDRRVILQQGTGDDQLLAVEEVFNVLGRGMTNVKPVPHLFWHLDAQFNRQETWITGHYARDSSGDWIWISQLTYAPDDSPLWNTTPTYWLFTHVGTRREEMLFGYRFYDMEMGRMGFLQLEVAVDEGDR